MSGAPTEYRLVLPEPWERIRLDNSMGSRVAGIIDRAVARLPKEVPPDQVAPHRRFLERELMKNLLEAQKHGGVDYYLPTDLMHGQQLNASFVVSAVIPDANAEAGLVPGVLASMLKESGTEAVSVGDTVWARREKLLRRDPDELLDESVRIRKVEYVTAVPGDERRWVIVTFTTAGDGDPESQATHLIVELFDAIMTTWRWVGASATRPEGSAG